MIGRLAGIVIDCPDPRALAGFYEALLGAKRVDDSDEWVTLTLERWSAVALVATHERVPRPRLDRG